MPSPDFGPKSIPSESSRQDDCTVQKSKPTEVVCPSKSTVKMSSSPAKKTSPAISSLICMYDTPLESSRGVDTPVQISASSDHVCPSISPVIFPPTLYTSASFTHSSIPAVSDHLCSTTAPIWNPRLQTRPSSLGPFPSVFGAVRNFRSENPGPQTLAAPPSNCNYSGFRAPLVNFLVQDAPLVMGKLPVPPISQSKQPEQNAQFQAFGAIPAPISVKSSESPAEFCRVSTGSGSLSLSPTWGGAPVMGQRVNSGNSPCVDSAIDPACTPLDSPRLRTFKEVLKPLLPRSTDRSFSGMSHSEVPQPTLREGIPGILFPDQVISSLSEPFKFALLGRITGNRGTTPNSVILDALARERMLGSYTVKFLPRGFMVFNLSTEEDYMFFWNKSIVSIGRVSIRFSKWTPEFKFEEDSSIVPVWVRFPDLPLHLYDRKNLYPISKILGNPVKIDEITASGSRGSFARVCIEIDVLQARQERIWVGWGDHVQTIDVIFEKVSHYCSHCKLLGHSLDFCSRHKPRRDPLKGKAPLSVPSGDRPGSSGPSFHVPFTGPAFEPSGTRWIQKQGRPRAGPQPATPVVQPSINPFEVLQTLQEDACPGVSPAVGVTPALDISQISPSVDCQSIPPALIVQAEVASVAFMDIQSASCIPSHPNVNYDEVGSALEKVDSPQVVTESPVAVFALAPVGQAELAPVVWPQVFTESPVPVPPYVPPRYGSRQPRVPGHQSLPVPERLRPNTRSFKMKAAKSSFQPP